MIAIPAYSGTIHIPTMRSLVTDMLGLAKAGIAITLSDEIGSTYLNDARSEILHTFVESQCTDLIFIDHDVCWPGGGMLRLLNHEVDIVGGIYPQRVEPIRFNVRTREENVYPVDEKTGLVDVLGLHTGFLRISKRAAVKMTQHYKDTDITYERQGVKIVGLFDPYRPEGTLRKLGDDYAFCQRWIDIGGKCWLDWQIPMGHIGLKCYAGEFGRFVEAANKDKAA